MNLRKTVTSLAAAAALSVAIAAPTFAASPTFTGSIWCFYPGDTEAREVSAYRTDWTKKEIAAAKKAPSVQSCVKGTIELRMTKN